MLPFSRFHTPMLGVACLLMISCGRDFGPAVQERTEVQNIEMDGADEVRVNLKMGAGVLRVSGGAEKLMEGRFTYNRLRYRPQVSYKSGYLDVEEPSGTHTATSKYVWDLRFNDAKPLDLEVNCGAGQTRLDLGELALRQVKVQMGVGELKMDLRGTPKNDYAVSVEGGVGEATIYLPHDVGIEAEVEGGIGGIHTPGLTKRDGRYVNEAFGHAKTNVNLHIEGGIGSIRLIAD
jgi:N-terminal domain of toast_rack, DUF2154